MRANDFRALSPGVFYRPETSCPLSLFRVPDAMPLFLVINSLLYSTEKRPGLEGISLQIVSYWTQGSLRIRFIS